MELSVICFVRSLINFSIAAIALDRVKAILKPHEYRQEASKKSIFISISLCWLISLVIGFSTMTWTVEGDECTFERIHSTPTLIYCIVGKIIPYTIAFCAYGYIFWSIRLVSLVLF